MQSLDLEKITRLACQAVEETAVFIRQETGKVTTGQIEEKHLNGLVSYVDRTAEEMLVERLSKIIPGSVFLTEEETILAASGDVQWIIDPLDGTTNFLYNLPQFAVSVGLKIQDELVCGVVSHVSTGELYYAWKGGGAWCDGRRIGVSTRREPREALVATGFPYHNFERAQAWLQSLMIFMQDGRGVRRFGAAALDLAWVACGKFDIFYEYGLSPWDVAGGAVIVREAGGIVSDFNGEGDFLHGKELLACSPRVYDWALGVTKSLFRSA